MTDLAIATEPADKNQHRIDLNILQILIIILFEITYYNKL